MIDKKASIFKAGRDEFYKKGFKEASISNIAKKAKIGVGTFYNYYPSKESLFIDVYYAENEELKKHLIESIDPSEDPTLLITKMVSKNLTEMNSNLILKEWYNKDLFEKLEKQYYTQGGIESFDEATHKDRINLIRKWKDEGKIRKDIDDDVINAIFSSIFYIDIHKNEIGIQYFPKIIMYITEFIMKGLTNHDE